MFLTIFDILALPIIKKIEFKGLKTLKRNELNVKSYLESKEGGVYQLSIIKKDIESLFDKKLFNNISVDCKTTKGTYCTEDSKEVILTYILKENPTVSSVKFVGYNEVELEDIEGVVNITPNSILDISKIEANREKILDLYKEKGLFLAYVTFDLVKKSHENIDIIFNIKENSKIIIRSIRFVGNQNIPDSEFKRVLLTKEGGYFSEMTDSGIFKASDFERDLAVVKLYCQEKGFFKAKVSNPADVKLSRDKKEMDITIYVEEGDKYFFGKFDVEGDLIYDKKKLLAPFKELENKEFKRSEIAQAVMNITNLYKNKGYADVSLSTPIKIDEKNKIIDIPMVIQKGEKSYIESIEFTGNTVTRDKVLRRELRIYEGDLYNQALIDYSKSRLFSLGYFETVDYSIQEGSRSGLKNIIITVKEKSTGTFQLGMGFSTVEKIVFNAQISKNNLFGNGQTVSLYAQLSSLQKYYSLSFTDPYFLDTLWDFTARLYNTSMTYNYFVKGTFGSAITVGHPITDFLRAYITLKAENVTVEQGGRINTDSDIPPIYGMFKDGRTVSLEGKLVYDRRDNRLFPKKGFYQDLTLENASYLSQNKFMKLSTDSRIYVPLFWKFVYRLNVRTGWIPDSKNVPIFERFYVGGIFTVRGFEWGSLSPTKNQVSSPYSAVTPFQIGGNKQFIINNEIEFDIIEAARIKGVFFIDSGNAYREEDPISFAGLRSSWGFGIRWFSPMGPLRFEWGFPFKPKEDERSHIFEFNIGNSF
jgi:outer membrane protein insertion porin family